jgi:hypothetical protein
VTARHGTQARSSAGLSAGDRSAARPRREVEQVKGVAADLEQVEEAAAARCFLSLPPSLSARYVSAFGTILGNLSSVKQKKTFLLFIL